MSKTVQAGDIAKNIHLWTTDDKKFSLFTATEESPVLLIFFPCAFTKHENKVNKKLMKLNLLVHYLIMFLNLQLNINNIFNEIFFFSFGSFLFQRTL